MNGRAARRRSRSRRHRAGQRLPEERLLDPARNFAGRKPLPSLNRLREVGDGVWCGTAVAAALYHGLGRESGAGVKRTRRLLTRRVRCRERLAAGRCRLRITWGTGRRRSGLACSAKLLPRLPGRRVGFRAPVCRCRTAPNRPVRHMGSRRQAGRCCRWPEDHRRGLGGAGPVRLHGVSRSWVHCSWGVAAMCRELARFASDRQIDKACDRSFVLLILLGVSESATQL